MKAVYAGNEVHYQGTDFTLFARVAEKRSGVAWFVPVHLAFPHAPESWKPEISYKAQKLTVLEYWVNGKKAA